MDRIVVVCVDCNTQLVVEGYVGPRRTFATLREARIQATRNHWQELYFGWRCPSCIVSE